MNIFTKIWIVLSGKAHEHLDAAMQSGWMAKHALNNMTKMQKRLDDSQASIRSSQRQYERTVGRLDRQIQELESSARQRFGRMSESEVAQNIAQVREVQSKIQRLQGEKSVTVQAQQALSSSLGKLNDQATTLTNAISQLNQQRQLLAIRSKVAKDIGDAAEMINVDFGEIGATIQQLEHRADKQEILSEIQMDRLESSAENNQQLKDLLNVNNAPVASDADVLSFLSDIKAKS